MIVSAMPASASPSQSPDLVALLQRVEAASGADREIDGQLASLGGWLRREFFAANINGASERVDFWAPPDADAEYLRDMESNIRSQAAFNLWGYEEGPPSYTASIDAAVALVEKALPGRTYAVDATAPELGIDVDLFVDTIADRDAWERGAIRGTAKTAPLAFCAALLKALIAPHSAPEQDTP